MQKTKTALIASALAVGLTGCIPEPDMQMQKQSAAAQVAAPQDRQRIQVTRVGVFGDDLAYNGRRGVYVITDAKSGKEYIGISGIGIQETGSRPAGKAVVSDER